MTTYNTASGLTDVVKSFYNRKLIERARASLVHTQFAQEGMDLNGNTALPQNEGSTVYFTKFGALTPNTTALSDEYTAPTGQSLTTSNVSATVAEYGDAILYTKKLTLTSFTSISDNVLDVIGQHAGESIDQIVRNVLAGGSNVMYAGGKTARTSLSYSDVLTPALVKRAARFLEAANTPKFGSDYIAIVHPFVKHDVMNDSDWEDASKYAGSTQIFSGEIGRLYGVRFVETTFAKAWTSAGSSGGTSSGAPSSEVADVYSTLFLGKNAYGVVSLDNLQFNAGGFVDDPLKRGYYASWYWLGTALRLTEDFMIRVESGYSKYAEDAYL